jgi:hypothetical protein
MFASYPPPGAVMSVPLATGMVTAPLSAIARPLNVVAFSVIDA